MQKLSDFDMSLLGGTVDPATLGQLLVVQSAMDAMPLEVGLISFLCKALEMLPGVTLVHACHKGEGVSGLKRFEEACAGCNAYSEPIGPALSCWVADQAGTLSLPLRTLDGHFGFLNLEFSDELTFAAYEPYVRNLVNHAATVLENRLSSRLLQQKNKELEQASAELETRVEQRTAELAELNRELREKVAERTRMTAQLERWAHIFEHAEWGVGVGSADWTTLELINPAFARMHGYTVEELMGRTIADVFDPAVRAEVPGQLRIAIERGHHTFESRHMRRDGTTFPVAVDLTVVKDDHGKVLYRVANVQDITERGRMEDELRRSRERFRSLVEATSDWLWETDETGTYVYVSPQCRDMLGYDPEQLIGKTPFDFMPQEEAERVKAIYEEIVAEHQPFSQIENVNLRSDGRLVVLETSGIPLFDAQGIFRGYRGIDRDVTERKQRQIEFEQGHAELAQAYQRLEETQNQLLQSEKMASIGHLAAGVAHEINNPIGYVSSNLGTLEGYLRDVLRVLDAYERGEALVDKGSGICAEVDAIKKQVELPYIQEDVVALVAESKEGLTRVKKIVQDLKDFSHTGASDEWQWVDLHRGLDSTLNIVWNELKYKADVVKEYGDIGEIECLPSQINQVFMNLLVNAAQAIEGRGRIVIRTGTRDDQVFVEIADTGTGISPQHQARIFDPFFTTKPVGKGTGLGLSLSYSIVQKHGGLIEVESEPGRGSAFRVVLPAGGRA